jgi:hypothetical protein
VDTHGETGMLRIFDVDLLLWQLSMGKEHRCRRPRRRAVDQPCVRIPCTHRTEPVIEAAAQRFLPSESN